MVALSPEIFELLRSVIEESWECLRPEEKARTSKAMLTQGIVQAAAAGERDPVRLRIEAVRKIVTFRL